MARTWTWLMTLGMVALAAGCGGSSSSTTGNNTGSEAGTEAGPGTEAGTDGATSTCPSGQEMCGGACVTLTADHGNCGSCGNACGAGEVCSAGKCQVSCPTGQSDCSGACVNEQTDHGNCGGCGKACGADEVCSSGTCQLHCTAGQTDCNGTCVNEQTDGNHCGSCTQVCGAGQVCSNGTCGLTCAANLTTCNATASGASDAGAGDAGTTDAATTDAAMSDAGGPAYCADLKNDRQNCGACGNVCPNGYVCSGSSCVLSCATGQTACGNACVNLQTDNANCGTCGQACATGEVCSSGQCSQTCGGATPTLCGTACVDTNTNRSNCGTCGNTCAAGQVCSAGSCTANCGTGLTVCSGACTNLDSDPANCGACGNACGGGSSCVGGQCTFISYPGSCAQIKTFNPKAKDGVYTIDPDGPSGPMAPFKVYCDMTDDGGGWTLLLKADGANPTFQYDKAIWTNKTALNPTSTDTSKTEAKFPSYWSVPFTALRVAVATASTNSAVLNASSSSLFAAESGNALIPTSLGRAGWLALFPGSAIQANCNQEGILNAGPTGWGRVRIGILGNEQNDCGSPDSYAGIGATLAGNGCYPASALPGPSVGVMNGGTCTPGNGSNATGFAWVYARAWATSCKEIHAWNGSAPSGIYTIDPDGSGPAKAQSVYCDMTTDGGGWTMVGRSVAASTDNNFGWDYATGSASDNTATYSMNAKAAGIQFTQILFGSYSAGKTWANAYEQTVGANFIATYATTDNTFGAPTTIAGTCTPSPTLNMFQYIGFTDTQGRFFFRDVATNDIYGLNNAGWNVFYNDCSHGGGLYGEQGMIFVR